MKSTNLFIVFLGISLTLLLPGCAAQKDTSKRDETEIESISENEKGIATFAGGCFWCIEATFDETEGIKEAISGYTGGTEAEATYKQVSTGKTGHQEVVQISYDPEKIDYKKLMEIFLQQIDPTDEGGQFSDRGFQYTTAIYYHDVTQKKLAEEALKELEEMEKFDKPIITPILPYSTFFPAEEYHQDFYKKSEDHYKKYKDASGRSDFISENWAKELALEFTRENEKECTSYKCFQKPSAENLKELLTPLAYEVTQENGTEQAFENEYWANKKEGIYVDIVSGEPLFSSKDKFDSDTGWPSFTQTISEDFVTLHADYDLGYERTEARSKIADSHLGHVFDDGPKGTGGKRWCINSASLKFIPKEKLTGEYAEFLESFK